jgi:hypothetical protein
MKSCSRVQRKTFEWKKEEKLVGGRNEELRERRWKNKRRRMKSERKFST